MDYAPIAGLIVVSVMSVLLFWKIIQLEYIEKAFITILSMIGFFCGLGCSLPIIIYLYIRYERISKSEWMTCVCISGIIALVGFSTIFFALQPKEVFAVSFIVYCLLSVVGLLSYVLSDDHIWVD
jgi:hypothetical protein